MAHRRALFGRLRRAVCEPMGRHRRIRQCVIGTPLQNHLPQQGADSQEKTFAQTPDSSYAKHKMGLSLSASARLLHHLEFSPIQ